jgi:hypothetical protein
VFSSHVFVYVLYVWMDVFSFSLISRSPDTQANRLDSIRSVGYVASYLRHCMQEHEAKIYPLL